MTEQTRSRVAGRVCSDPQSDANVLLSTVNGALSGVLEQFILLNHDAIVTLAQARVAARMHTKSRELAAHSGVPVFLTQLGEALRRARTNELIDDVDLNRSAGQHGLESFRAGLSIGQVVHDYGDVCQTITALAMQQEVSIAAADFRTLNLCLDNAIAQAVSEYARQRELSISDHGSERLGKLANELRAMLDMATLAFESIKTGLVAPSGSTAVVLGESLLSLRELIDRSLAELRLDAGTDHRETIVVAEFMEEVEIGAVFQAQALGLHFVLSEVDRSVAIEGDRQILSAALANMLQNAFKFTRKHSVVSLFTRVTADRVSFEVEDQCGGLQPAVSKHLHEELAQDAPRATLGEGLSICLKAARANAGELSVRDRPGLGCVFVLGLPRKHTPPLTVINGGKDGDVLAQRSARRRPA